MKENAIISLADSNYFELLNELIDSIKRFEQSNKVEICIMDAGLKEDQIDLVEKKADFILAAIQQTDYLNEIDLTHYGNLDTDVLNEEREFVVGALEN